MSTPAHFESKIISYTVGAQSSRVPTPLPDDLYVAVRQAHLVDTDTKSEPKEAPSEIEEFQPLVSRVPLIDEEFEVSEPSDTRITSSHSSASSDSTAPLSPDHPLTQTSPTRVSFHCRTAHMARTLRMRVDSDTKREGSEDEGHGSEDEGRSLEDEGPGLKEDEEEATPEGQQQAVLIVYTAADKPLGLGYGALRHQQQRVEETPTPRPRVRITWVDPVDGKIYTDIPVDVPPARVPVQTPPSPDWSSGSLPVSPLSPAVPTPVASPVTTPAATIAVDEDEFLEVGAQLELHGSILHDHMQRLDALPPTLFEGYDRDLRELYTRSGAVRDEIFSQRYRLRCLEQEQKRATVTFGALWRPMLALDSWAGYVDAQRAEMWRARYDDHRLIHDLLVQHTTMQRELQEIRGRVATLEQERSRREQQAI
ncbi:hypothetical protein Tco_0780890 [Tanacetum coccineum]